MANQAAAASDVWFPLLIDTLIKSLLAAQAGDYCMRIGDEIAKHEHLWLHALCLEYKVAC